MRIKLSSASTVVKLILTFALALGSVNVVRAENFVFETASARLVIRPDGIASSLIEKQNGQERLRPQELAFAAVKKAGRLFPASAIERRGALLHVTFGDSGVSADYSITPSADSIVVELAKVQGEGIEEIRLMQLSTPLANTGGLLGVQWDNDFAVCLIGLSEQVDVELQGPVLSASVYPEFAMQGERVALIAVPTPQFLDAVQQAEREFHLPSPTIAGKWAKLSTDVRTNYLFTDLTEANVDQTIRYAKMGGFRYILIYSDTWSSSLGSYPINLKSFPHGEAGLKAVIDKCHAAGLKVGLHMLTSFVGKNDALAGPKPDPGLLKDGEATLAANTSATATNLAATSAPAPGNFPVQADGTATDIVIDEEILHCGRIEGARFLACERGFAGTKPAPHRAGAKIQRLVQRDGAYLADLKSPLKDAIAERIANLIDQAGFDMIYFDGGELSSADGPSWYWVGVEQSEIWQRSKRDLLVQGSGMTQWTWHIFSRATSDDYAAVAVKQYLDFHKIADYRRYYYDNFLPAELGWVGFLPYAPDHPATTPDEIEYYAVRMLALDSPLSLETSLSALQANGRTEEMLKLLGEYEQLQLSGVVPKAVREQLAHGEWHMTRPGEFHPIRYDAQRTAMPGKITVRNEFGKQPLKFRLQVEPQLAPSDPSNIPLLGSEKPIEISAPAANAAMPGALIQRIALSKAAKALDLTTHRALAVELEVEGPAAASGPPPVLNLQLEAGGGNYRDYYVDLDFRGAKTIILPQPGTSRMLADFRPALANYSFKAAMYSFNYANVVALNLRWMRYPAASGVRCRVLLVEALEERNSVLHNIDISTGQAGIAIPGEMTTGDYAEYWGQGPVRIFDRNGMLLRTTPVTRVPELSAGENTLMLAGAGSGNVKLTAITLGN